MSAIEGVEIVRYAELVPCRTAFIDSHTPGSDQKENFAIIGGGVSENPDQHVHIQATPGFNIGAAGQPPHCRNSLHSHTTAEVFFVLHGRWRFFWGRRGDAGSVVLEEGDVFSIPTGVFRGFENVGQDYGMMMAILGGDDAGGGVTWAPQVIEEARDHGLVLADNGRIYDTARGEALPQSFRPMPLLSDEELAHYAEPTPAEIVPHFVARHLDLRALAADRPVPVIGAHALIADRPGFELDFITERSLPPNRYTTPSVEVLLVHRGHWRLGWGERSELLAPGDTCAVAGGIERELAAAVSGSAGLFRVRATSDAAGPTRALLSN